MRIPQAPTLYTRQYNKFRGVDFSTDPALIDPSRSPLCQNLISDAGGYPEKRTGWETSKQFTGERINGIYRLVDSLGFAHYLVHHAAKLSLVAAGRLSTAFSTTTTTPPADKTLRYNNATPASVTEIYIDETDSAAADASARIAQYAAGDIIRVSSDTNAALYHLFTITSNTDNGTYRTLVVTYLGGATGNFTNADAIGIRNSDGGIAGADNAVDWTGPVIALSTAMNDARSNAIAFDNRLFILDGANYKVFDGAALADVDTDNTAVPTSTFIPTTHIGMLPAGGGTALEAVNLLTPWRKNSFIGDGASVDYFVDTGEIDDTTSIVAVVGGVTLDPADYTINYATGKVTFDTPPADGSGVDNVVITFAFTVAGYADKIKKCRFAMWFGAGVYSRLFVSGNPEFRNYDWVSGLYDPSYFPDTGYTIFGTSASAIMGYTRQYDSMMIVKEDNNQDTSLFVRTSELDDSGNVIFPLKPGVTGIGAVSMYAFGILRDEPLLLARQGVFTPTLAYGGAGMQRSMQSRSYFIDARLLEETALEEAVGIVWNGYYLLSVNGVCYVADSRQKTSKSKTEGTSYEWYYWTNIAARVFADIDDVLYFGTADGHVRKFKTESDAPTRYNDDTTAIDAIWATNRDDDGDFMRLKTMPRNGSGVLIKPYSHSSVTVYFTTEDETDTYIGEREVDVFDFNNIDFERFTFNTDKSPALLPFDFPVRKYRTIQLIARNNVLSEGFGVFGFIKRYHFVRYVKE